MNRENDTNFTIQHSIDIGDAAAFDLVNIDSDQLDSNAALWSCMTTCVQQLAMRGWDKQELIESVGSYYTAAQGLLAEWHEETR